MTNNLFNPARAVNYDMIGRNGNAFVLLGGWQRQARREGWSDEDVNKVVDKATSGDYNNLLSVLSAHCNMDSEDI